MNVLSLFDGMSGAQLALKRAGINYENYFSSEVDKYAIKITQKNFPETIQLGDVCRLNASTLPKIDLLVGGSPCQGFSFAGKQLNFNDPRSKLFFEYVRLLKELKPRYFLLENVKMKKEYQEVISQHLGIEPVEINSALVSGQNRKRLYWTNIVNISQPKDRLIFLKDVIESDPKNITPMSQKFIDRFVRYGIKFTEEDDIKAKCLCAREYEKNGKQGNYLMFQINPSKKCGNKQPYMQDRVFHSAGKVHSLTASFAGRTNVGDSDIGIRKLTPIECERLQTVPDNYTSGVSNTQRYKMIGNGFTVDVIAHILKQIKL